MNAHLQRRVNDLLHRHNSATLATCGPAGPQVSIVSFGVQQLCIHLTLSYGSDHLFNLETQPLLALLTSSWRLHGQGYMIDDTYQHQQATVVVTATRLHILSNDSQHTIETIDF